MSTRSIQIWPGLALLMAACVVPLRIGMLAWAQETVPTEAQYAAIQTAFLREDFERVVALARPILAEAFLEPKTARIWLWLVLSYERLQQARDALSELERLKASLSSLPAEKAMQVGADSVWPEILFWEGEMSRKALKMVRARLAYQRLLTQFPTSVWRTQAQVGLGRVLFHEQAYEEAAHQFHQVVLASPPDSPIAYEVRLLEGLCALQRQRFAEAVEAFRQLLEQPLDRTTRAQAAFYLGESLTGLRRFEEANHAYQQAIDFDPHSRWAQESYFGLGWSEFQQHRCRESLEAFARYASTLPASRQPSGQAGTESAASDETARFSGEMLFAQGQCLMELGKETEALARFDALRRSHPDHPLAIEAALRTAELLERARRFADARSVLQAVSARNLGLSHRLQIHLRVGSIELAQGDATNAVVEFQAAQDAPDDELRQAALNGLGDARFFLGEYEEATHSYRQALQLAPLSQGALYATYQLGRVKLQVGKANEAIELFQGLVTRAQALAPQATSYAGGGEGGRTLAVDVRLALAFAYLANAQPALARVELEQVRMQDPTSPQAARAGYYLALLLVNDGKVAEAKRLCEDVIDRLPHSDEALEARLFLADLVASQSSPREALVALANAFSEASGLPSRQRGRLAKKLGDLARRSLSYAQAMHWYEIAWQDLPAQRGELDYRLASCYEETGDVMVAIGRYRAITQAPWQIRGQLAAAKLMEREAQWQEAMRIYRRIAEQSAPEAKIAQERLTSLGKTQP